ncbi:PaaI family thioesterase [Aeromicrobium alkaliterrae]|uniref:PaaI family thioesterase n=1 Tax=Aeromicrobium alkaliterrae TaxID=302168 RepID=A0ABN2JGY8_9ACTN
MSQPEIDPDLAFIREAVHAMPIARTLGVEVTALRRGHAELRTPIADAMTFRPGQLQAAAVFAAGDCAAVAAAGTLLEPGSWAATIDGTIKLVAPASGTGLRAVGRVVDAGRLLTTCAAEVYAVDGDAERLCATWLGTARRMTPRLV